MLTLKNNDKIKMEIAESKLYSAHAILYMFLSSLSYTRVVSNRDPTTAAAGPVENGRQECENGSVQTVVVLPPDPVLRFFYSSFNLFPSPFTEFYTDLSSTGDYFRCGRNATDRHLEIDRLSRFEIDQSNSIESKFNLYSHGIINRFHPFSRHAGRRERNFKRSTDKRRSVDAEIEGEPLSIWS